MKDPITITLEILWETENAFKVTDCGDFNSNTWIPKSQIELLQEAEIGDTVEVEMPEWLAKDKGFI